MMERSYDNKKQSPRKDSYRQQTNGDMSHRSRKFTNSNKTPTLSPRERKSNKISFERAPVDTYRLDQKQNVEALNKIYGSQNHNLESNFNSTSTFQKNESTEKIVQQ